MLISKYDIENSKLHCHRPKTGDIISKTVNIHTVCQYFRNAVTCEPRIWHLDVIFYADLKYIIENLK